MGDCQQGIRRRQKERLGPRQEVEQIRLPQGWPQGRQSRCAVAPFRPVPGLVQIVRFQVIKPIEDRATWLAIALPIPVMK